MNSMDLEDPASLLLSSTPIATKQLNQSREQSANKSPGFLNGPKLPLTAHQI